MWSIPYVEQLSVVVIDERSSIVKEYSLGNVEPKDNIIAKKLAIVAPLARLRATFLV